MGDQIRRVSEEYTRLIKEAKTPKQRAALEKQREADIRDITAMRDRLLGTYGAHRILAVSSFGPGGLQGMLTSFACLAA